MIFYPTITTFIPDTQHVFKVPIQVSRMTEADIDGAIDTIQQAFANDPYNRWMYPDRSKVPTLPTAPMAGAHADGSLTPYAARNGKGK